jgi:6-phosphofructokinase
MSETVAILVGGGPAPGINGVIASAAMEASKCGLRPIGIYDGYRDLAAGRTPQTIELTFDQVSRIHTSGGSILRTCPHCGADAGSDRRRFRAQDD